MSSTLISAIIISQALWLPAYFAFFMRYKYVLKTNIRFWGVFLLTDPVMLLVSVFFFQFVFKSNELKDSYFLFSNLLRLFEFGFLIYIFQANMKINRFVIQIIVIIFLLIWSIEFFVWSIHPSSTSPNIQHIDRLHITPVFLGFLVISGVWIYLFNLYKNSLIPYKRIPFFWVSLGWLLYYSVSITTFFEELNFITNPKIRYAILALLAIAQFTSSIFYGIGFWKTKDWVLQNYKSND